MFYQHPEPKLNYNPVYYELDRKEWPVLMENSVLNNVKHFYMTDDHMQPMHIENKAQNTEFYLVRGSDTLLVVVGESWTYGESLQGVGSAAGMFDLHSQLQGCFGPRIAEITGYDLYQFAIPGNCNLYMHLELERILKYVETLGYKQVKVILQMTENGREFPIAYTSYCQSHPLKKWVDAGIETEMSIEDWLSLYDEIFYESFDRILKDFKACPIEGILFRNFTQSVKPHKNYIFKYIEPSWITYTAKLVNHTHIAPYIINLVAYLEHIKNHKKKIKMSREFTEHQIGLVEKLYDYIKGNGSVPGLLYHNNHPTKHGHLVWALYLTKQAGWKDI